MQADNRRGGRHVARVSKKTADCFVVSARRRGVLFHSWRFLIPMIAGVWTCFAGSLAYAQTPITLVSNLAQTIDAPQFDGEILRAWENQDLGIVFRTGPSQSGTLLSAVALDVNRWPRGTTPTVSIYRAELVGDPGLPAPTTRIATLDNPWAAKGWRTFTVSSRVQLKPNRFYAIVVESTATTVERAFELRGTQSYEEDASSQADWDIERITNVNLGMGWEGTDASASTQKVRFAAHGYDAGEVWREGAKLESLAVTPVSGSLVQFTPSFKPGRRGPYTVWVTHDTTQVTLAAMAESSSARVEMPDDVNPSLEGTQINLPAGTTTTREIRVIDGPSGIFRTFYQLNIKRPGSMLTGKPNELEPISSDGSLQYRFVVKLSAPVELSLAHWRSYVFHVANGAIAEVKRVGGSAAGPGGDPISRTWHVTVNPADPASDTDVTFRTKPGCTSTGAVCTVGGLKLDSFDPVNFSPSDVRSVSIEDASADEQDGEIVFTVSLSKRAQRYVYVDFETIDSGSDKGTATPGADYRPQFTRLVIPPGIASVEAGVALIDDSIDDDGETVKVRLSNARQVNDVGGFLKPIRIGAAEATGTIRNSDAIPQAWLARFGRTVADQVLDAVESRMQAPRTPGVELSVAGQRVGGGRAPALNEARDAEAGLETVLNRLRPGIDEENASGFASRAVTGHHLLAGSSFAFTGGTPESGVGTLWGRGAVSRFHGREGTVSLDGDVASALAGLDWTRGRTTAGLVVSHSRGDGGYTSSSDAGTVESTLTGLYPWGRYALNDRLSVWGVAGYGAGELVLTPKEKPPIETDMDLRMAAAGLRGVLIEAPANDGFELAVTSDGLMVSTSSDEVRGSTGSLAASEADVTRLRVGLEGLWRGLDAGGGSFVPSFEIGMRQDGGDAETGLGVDAGVGLAWADPTSGVKAELRARALLTHEEDGFRERGLAGTLAWDPDPESDLGPALSLSQAAGASASGGMKSLFGPGTAGALGVSDDDRGELDRGRLKAKFGYGFALFDGRYTGTPRLGFGLSDAEREITLGWRIAEVRRGGLGFALEVEGARQASPAGDGKPGHHLALGLGWSLEGAQTRDIAFELWLEGSRHVAAAADGEPENRVGLRMTARW